MYKIFCWPFRDPGWDAYFKSGKKFSAKQELLSFRSEEDAAPNLIVDWDSTSGCVLSTSKEQKG